MKVNIIWDITRKCNESCKFCYRNKSKQDLSLSENIKILKDLYSSEITNRITICGGEPLMYNELFSLLETVEKPEDVKLHIITNGIVLADYIEASGKFVINKNLLEKVIRNFEGLCFSLDASNTDIEVAMSRNKQHYNRIMFILQYLDNNYNNLDIKINSVVTKKNYEDMPNLYERLIKFKHIKKWQLFRYLRNSYNHSNSGEINEQFEVSDNNFNTVIKFVEGVNNKNLKINVNNIEDYNNKYVMIKQDGTVEINVNTKLKEVLDLKKYSIKDILTILGR